MLGLEKSTTTGAAFSTAGTPRLIPKPRGHRRRQLLRADREVDEAGPGDLGLQAEVGEGGIRLQLLHDRVGDLAGRLLQGFGQGQGAVGLEIAELRFARRRQLRIEPGPRCGLPGLRKGSLHCTAQLGVKGVGDAQHGQQR